MLPELEPSELPDGWVRVDDPTESVTGDSNVVATHESGIDLLLDGEGDVTVCSVAQSFEIDGYAGTVVTDNVVFRDSLSLRSHIDSVLESGADQLIEPIGAVGHNGSMDSIDLNAQLDDPSFVDVVAVYPNKLPKKVEPDDVQDVSDELVRVLYGETTEDFGEPFLELEDENMAYGETRIDVITVPSTELESVAGGT